jgi:hypothetical protein
MKNWIAAIAVGLAALPLGRASAAGIVDAVELGALAHDVPIGDSQREDGVDGNAELRFVSPGFLAALGAPRPHFGIDANSAGKNSMAYGGLTWTANFSSLLFGDLGLRGFSFTNMSSSARTFGRRGARRFFSTTARTPISAGTIRA